MDELKAFMGGADSPESVATGKEVKAEKKDKEAEKAAKKAAADAKKAAKKAEKEAAKAAKPKKDNIARLNGMKTIAEVRKALQIAIAKKAKSIDRPDAVARYEKEIATAREILAAKMAEAEKAEDKVAALLEMGEEPNKVISMFIQETEAAQKVWLEGKGAKVPKNVIQDIVSEIPDSFFNKLGIDLQDKLADRFNKKDYRLQSICRMQNFITAVDNGEFVIADGKFVDPDQKVKDEAEKAKKEADKEAKKAEKKAAKEAEKAAKKAAKDAEKAAKAEAEKAAKEASGEAASPAPTSPASV